MNTLYVYNLSIKKETGIYIYIKMKLLGSKIYNLIKICIFFNNSMFFYTILYLYCLHARLFLIDFFLCIIYNNNINSNNNTSKK